MRALCALRSAALRATSNKYIYLYVRPLAGWGGRSPHFQWKWECLLFYSTDLGRGGTGGTVDLESMGPGTILPPPPPPTRSLAGAEPYLHLPHASPLPKGEGVLSSSEARADKYSTNSKPSPGPGLSAPLRLKKRNKPLRGFQEKMY